MAEDKKGFILYADIIHVVKKLPKEKIGELFLTILEYVNDTEPVVDDIAVDLVFEPIKQQLKRDLVKYGKKKQGFIEGGKASAAKRLEIANELARLTMSKQVEEQNDTSKVVQPSSTTLNQGEGSLAKSTVNDNVNVSVNDNVTVNVIKKEDIDARKLKFSLSLEPFAIKYPRGMLVAFVKYWTEPNKSKTKFRQELEKTWDLGLWLETWAKNDKDFIKNQNNTPASTGSKPVDL